MRFDLDPPSCLFRSLKFLKGSSQMDRACYRAGPGRPWDRSCKRPVNLVHPGAVVKPLEPPAVGGTYPGTSQPEELARRHIAQDDLSRGQFIQAIHLFPSSDLAPQGAQMPCQCICNRL